MTPNEITTLIATNLKKELDMRFKKQLYERVKYWRSTLIKQSLDRAPGDIKFFTQTLYIPTEKVNSLDCTADLKCFMARTSYDVPQPMRVTDGGLFSYVGSLDGGRPFGYADTGTLRFLNAGKYNKRNVYYIRINKRIMVTSLPDLPIVRIDGVLNNPEEGLPFASCNGVVQDCDWWDIDIPMSGDVAQRIVQSILSIDYGRPVTTDTHQIQVNDPK